jgi:hypothetical protein
MENNSFSFMKEGFDWQSEQSNDMAEIRNDAIYEEERERRAGIDLTEDRHDSDEEELKRESAELRDYSDFFADAGGFLGDR